MKTKGLRLASLLLVGLALLGCESSPGAATTEFTVTTVATDDEGLLLSDYGASPGDQDNLVSFPFRWSGLPAGTKALALIMLDKSYDDYVHWLAADIDPSLGGLPADASRTMSFPQGTNDNSGGFGYVGPMPPNRHLYLMTAYALSEPTKLEGHFVISELEDAMKGKILATAELALPYEPQ